MTNKKRSKSCLTCGEVFTESKRESNKQWESRECCSMVCSNRSINRVTHIFERLERFQVVRDGCWGWSGNSDWKGYGMLSNRKGAGFSPEKAHRVSYEKAFGEIPRGLNICHKCDNPECTNPDHLFAGTQKENMQDCSNKGRLSKKSLDNLNRSKSLSSEQVSEIEKIKFVGGNGRGEGRTRISVAKEYGVSVDIIGFIKRGSYVGY